MKCPFQYCQISLNVYPSAMQTLNITIFVNSGIINFINEYQAIFTVPIETTKTLTEISVIILKYIISGFY